MAFETEQDDDVQSLRDELAAAFEADEATEKPVEADPAPKAPKAAKADEEPAQDDETASERARDATGKFAPKTADELKPLDAGEQDAPTAPPVTPVLPAKLHPAKAPTLFSRYAAPPNRAPNVS